MANATDHGHIGRRVREIRTLRGLSLEALAGLAGLSAGYVSRIERGERAVSRHSTLEALANALRVDPIELTRQPIPDVAANPDGSEAQAAVIEIELVLSGLGLGDEAAKPRPWPEVAKTVADLNDRLRPAADYAAQGTVLPKLIAELNALYSADPAHRKDILVALLHCYHAAATLVKNQGVRGLASLAVFHARRAAEELEDPAWLGAITWVHALAIGEPKRQRMLDISLEGARELEPHLADDRALQMYGMLRLNAALASAAMNKPDDARAYLAEAAEIASRRGRPQNPGDRRGFANLYFGLDNVGIWQVSIAVELGEHGKAREYARKVDPTQVPSAARQAMYWADLGRSLAVDRSAREKAVAALCKAEGIAPQLIRANPFVRETVLDLVRRTRHETVGVDLRGMAYRMRISL